MSARMWRRDCCIWRSSHSPSGGGESAVDLAHDMIVRIGVEDGEAERLHADVATHVRRLTGFDRVMVYTASSPTVPAR